MKYGITYGIIKRRTKNFKDKLKKGVDLFMKILEVEIKNEQGVHARPVTLIARLAKKYKSTLKIKRKDEEVDAKNVFGIMTLGAEQGEKLTLIADGEDENELLENLKKLIEVDKFFEE